MTLPLRLARPLGALLLLLAAGVSSAGADTASIVADRDNTLYESAPGALSNGAGASFFAGRTQQTSNSIRRGLVHFNVAGALPAGAVIGSAKLRLIMSQTVSGPSDVALHRVNADWGEGNSDAGPSGGAGAPSQAGDATWRHRFFPGIGWTTAGGDFAAVASATLSVDQPATYVWGSTAAMVADAQSWLDSPATNFGWLLKGDETSAPTVKKFESSESTGDSRPVLEIEYSLPTPAEAASWGRVKGVYR